MSKLLNSFSVAMQKFAMQRHLIAVRDGMMVGMAPSLIGSLFLIIRFFPIGECTAFMDSHIIGKYLLYPVVATMDMLGICMLIGISYRLAESYKIEPLGAVITAVISYMVVNPISILVNVAERADAIAVAGVPLTIMGTRGLFVAIIVALLAVEVYRNVIKANLVITMPDSVPPAVSKSFIAIIPTLGAVLVMFSIRLFFENTSYGTLSEFISQTLSSPLKAGVKSLGGAVAYKMIYAFFWAFGIHGGVIESVYSPIWVVINDENRMAFQQGLPLPNVMTQQYLDSFSNIGGTGVTLAFVVLTLVFARSKHLKQVGKLAIGPGLFNINEPVIFGVPVVLNPIMMIPFIFVPGILAANAYIWSYLGWINRPTGILAPWTLLGFFKSYLQSDGDIRAVFLSVLNFVIAMACYYPFFKIIDMTSYKKEQE